MDLQKLLKENREEILRIATKHGASNVRIFGSVARNQASETSDIDFLIHLEDGRSLLDLIRFDDDLQALLKCKIDVISDGALDPQKDENIFAEAIAL